MKYLFVGGCKDGKWMELERAEQFVRMAHPLDMVFNSLMAMVADTRVEYDTYKRQTWCGEGEAVFRFYALQTLECNEAFGMLMKGYRRTV